MKLGLHFRDALEGVSPWLVAELDQLVEAIRTSYLIEHDADGRQRQVHVRAELLASQSLTHDTITRLLVGRRATITEHISLDTASGIVTVREPGVYTLVGQVQYAFHATGARVAILYRDLTEIAYSQIGAAAADVIVVPVSATVPCVRGATLSLHGYQNSGGALNVLYNKSFLTVTRVG